VVPGPACAFPVLNRHIFSPSTASFRFFYLALLCSVCRSALAAVVVALSSCNVSPLCLCLLLALLCRLAMASTGVDLPVKPAAPARAPSPKHESRPKAHITDLPITVGNWYKHVNWLNVIFIGGLPLAGCIAACFTPLYLKTAIWAVIYYFFTGLGKFAQLGSVDGQLTDFEQELPLDTIVCGPTRVTLPLVLSKFSWLWWVEVQLKVQSAGGAVISKFPLWCSLHN
jgi:hypothetical protein